MTNTPQEIALKDYMRGVNETNPYTQGSSNFLAYAAEWARLMKIETDVKKRENGSIL